MANETGRKKTFQFRFGIIIGSIFMAVVVITIFLTIPKIRHGTFLMAQKIPGGG